MKLALFTTDLPEANIITQRLLAKRGDQVCGVFHSDIMMAGKPNRDAYAYLGRRMGLRYGGSWQAHRTIARIGAMARVGLGQAPGYGSLKYIVKDHDIPLVATSDINAGPSLDALGALKPDLIVSNYFNQVIKQPILGNNDWQVINIHPALLPRNRGLMPCFWALANGDSETGVTVHRVDAELDTGVVLAQCKVPIRTGDSVVSLSERCSEAASDLVLKVIRDIEAGTTTETQQDPTGTSYYSWPSPAGIRKLYKRGHRYGSLAEMTRQAIKPPGKTGTTPSA